MDTLVSPPPDAYPPDVFRDLFEANPHPLFVFARDGIRLPIVAANRAALGQYGYTRAEFLRLDLLALRPPPDVPFFVGHLPKAVKGPRKTAMWRHVRKDGQTIEVEATVAPLRWGARPAFLVQAVDVTARRREQQRLAADLEPSARGDRAEGLTVREHVEYVGALVTAINLGLSVLGRHVHPDGSHGFDRLAVLASLACRELGALSTSLAGTPDALACAAADGEEDPAGGLRQR